MGKSRCQDCTSRPFPCLNCLVSKERYGNLLRDLDSGAKLPKNIAEQQYLHRSTHPPYPQPQPKGAQPQSQSIPRRPNGPAVNTRSAKRAHKDHDNEQSGKAKRARHEFEDYTRIIHGDPSLLINTSNWQERFNGLFSKHEVPSPVAPLKGSPFQPPVSQPQRPSTMPTAPNPSPLPESWSQDHRELPTKRRTPGPAPAQQAAGNTEQSFILAQQQPTHKSNQAIVRLPPQSMVKSEPESSGVSQRVPQQISPTHSSGESSAASRPVDGANDDQSSQIRVTRTIDGRQYTTMISVAGSTTSITINLSPGSVTITTPSEPVCLPAVSDSASTTADSASAV